LCSPLSSIGPFELHLDPRADFLEDRRIAAHAPEDVHGAGRTDLVPSTDGRASEEDAEGAPGRPVAEVAERDDLLRRFRGDGETDVEVDLVAPRARFGLDRQRVPDRA